MEGKWFEGTSKKKQRCPRGFEPLGEGKVDLGGLMRRGWVWGPEWARIWLV